MRERPFIGNEFDLKILLDECELKGTNHVDSRNILAVAEFCEELLVKLDNIGQAGREAYLKLPSEIHELTDEARESFDNLYQIIQENRHGMLGTNKGDGSEPE